MYGRAKLDLLEARLVGAARTNSQNFHQESEPRLDAKRDPLDSSYPLTNVMHCVTWRWVIVVRDFIRLDDRKRGKRLLRDYEHKLRRGLNALSWLIARINTPTLRDMFMALSDLFGIRNRLLPVVARDFYETP